MAETCSWLWILMNTCSVSRYTVVGICANGSPFPQFSYLSISYNVMPFMKIANACCRRILNVPFMYSHCSRKCYAFGNKRLSWLYNCVFGLVVSCEKLRGDLLCTVTAQLWSAFNTSYKYLLLFSVPLATTSDIRTVVLCNFLLVHCTVLTARQFG
jgi:hypothetical protein